MKALRIIAITYALVVLALGVSLYWNVKQAIDSSARGQALYKTGLRDGEIFTRNQILRADLERDIIEDQKKTANRRGAGL